MKAGRREDAGPARFFLRKDDGGRGDRTAHKRSPGWCSGLRERETAQTPENGCLAVSFLAVTSSALGSPLRARAIDFLVAL